MKKLKIRKMRAVEPDNGIHPTLGRRNVRVPSDIPPVAGLDAANREIARWPEWKRQILFGAFGVSVTSYEVEANTNGIV